MRIVLQRVRYATVSVAEKVVAKIGRGITLLIGIAQEDRAELFPGIARKLVELRIFEDEAGKMNLSLRDIEGEILAVPQFTLYGDIRKGRRPSFTAAAPPEQAAPLFDTFIEALEAERIPVCTGIFGAKMAVELVNDGPVTFILDLAPSPDGG
jgi:D-tyrosyl-tRNA(Tyr) deacylase